MQNRTLRIILKEHIDAAADAKRGDAEAHSVRAKKIVEKIAGQLSGEKQLTYLQSNLQLVADQKLEQKVLDEAKRLQTELNDCKDAYEQSELVFLHQKNNAIQTDEKERAKKDQAKQAVETAKEQLEIARKAAFAYLEKTNYSLDDAKWMHEVDQLCTAPIRNTGVITSIFDKPIVSLNIKPNSKFELREHLDRQKEIACNMDNYLFVKDKSGGVNSPGIYGGEYICCYETPGGDVDVQRSLIKQDNHVPLVNLKPWKEKKLTCRPEKDIIEYVAGRIMNELIGDKAASVLLVRSPWDAQTGQQPLDAKTGQSTLADLNTPDNTGINTYAMSIFYDNFDELYRQLYKEAGQEPPEDRPKRAGTLFQREFTQIFKTQILDPNEPSGEVCRYDDFDPTVAASLLIRDFDAHTANFGVIDSPVQGGKKELRRIDFGGALKKLDEDVHMHSHWRHKVVGMEPTNHFRELRRSLKINPHFAAELERLGAFDETKFSDGIDRIFADVGKMYGEEPIKRFAKRMGHQFGDAQGKDQLLATTKDFFKQKMFARQISLRKLALEIKLSHAAEYKDGALTQNKVLDDLIEANPTYFMRGKFHFRHKRQQFKVEYTATNVTRSPWWSGAVEGDAVKALHERVDNILEKMPDVLKPDFALENTALRAEVFVARLQILAQFYNDGTKGELLREAKTLQEWLTRHKSDKERLKDDASVASETNVVFLCDQAYGSIKKHYEQLVLDPVHANKVQELMQLEKHFPSLEEKVDQEFYAKSFTRTAKEGKVHIFDKNTEFNDNSMRYHPLPHDHLYNGNMFKHYNPPVAVDNNAEAILSTMVAIKGVSSVLNDVTIALTALQVALEKQYGFAHPPAPASPII